MLGPVRAGSQAALRLAFGSVGWMIAECNLSDWNQLTIDRDNGASIKRLVRSVAPSVQKKYNEDTNTCQRLPTHITSWFATYRVNKSY